MNTITDKIIRRIRAKQRGWVFTPKDFLDVGSRATVDKVLSRLAMQHKIRRLDRGLYDFPKQHTRLGILSPNIDHIARAIATQWGDIAFPSGAMAANLLGLSTQVPAKPVYLINGSSRTKQVAGYTLIFKHARIPLIHHLSDQANYLLQALSYLGKDHMSDDTIAYCATKLSPQHVKALSGIVVQLPGWMADIIQKIQCVQDGKFCQAA